jgi:hypothetical protein
MRTHRMRIMGNVDSPRQLWAVGGTCVSMTFGRKLRQRAPLYLRLSYGLEINQGNWKLRIDRSHLPAQKHMSPHADPS